MKKKSLWILAAIVLILSAVTLLACGGGGGATDTGDTGTEDDTGVDTGDGTVQPAIPGFTLSLKPGDYWEYRWDYYKYSYAQGGTAITARQPGRYRVTLGEPAVIVSSGPQPYPVLVTGVSGPSFDETVRYAPRWKYLAVENNTLLGSIDGVQFSVIFDAQNGFWPGGGFFKDLGTTSLNQAAAGTVETARYGTQLISGSAYKTGLSGSESTCQYYPGIGTICGDSSYSYDQWEYYLPDIGPLGFYYYNSYSDSGGNFYSTATWEQMVGLASSSLRGDTVDYVLENEPNDSVAGAQELANGVAVKGSAWPFAPGWDVTGLGILAGPDIYNWSVIEDVYKFTLPLSLSNRTVTITIDFPSAAGADTDYDIYLLNGTGTSVIASSTSDNKGTGVYTESITWSLPSGPFLIGVEAFSNGANAEYDLKVSW